MQPHSFSKRQLAAITLLLNEEEKNSALSDKKKLLWFFLFEFIGLQTVFHQHGIPRGVYRGCTK
jgi:hypothetical protein